MNEQVKERAWQVFCERLEALGVDPYSPDLPPSDSRYRQLQTAVSEYEIAVGKVIPLPPSWEGSSPECSVQSLGGLIEWLQGEWNLILAYEMGGGSDQPHLLDKAKLAVRNTFRVLDWLGVDERPNRPVPPKSVAGAKEQINDLEKWVRRKVKAGWVSTQAGNSQVSPTSSAPPTRRRKRSEILGDEEANLLIKKHLVASPKATIKEISIATSISTGRIWKLDAWRRAMAERRAGTKPIGKVHRTLTKQMGEAIGRKDDPAARLLSEEAVWQILLENAQPNERAKLHLMNASDKSKLIELAIEQSSDASTLDDP